MSLCAMCGMPVIGEHGICAAHHTVEDGWAEANRMMCDLLHRGLEPRVDPDRAPA